MPELKDSFCVVKLIEPTELQRANLRGFLKDRVYIEVGDNFIVSIVKSFKTKISKSLKADGAKFILIYTNLRAGADVLTNGISQGDKTTIEDIVFDNE